MLDSLLPFRRRFFNHGGHNIHFVDEGPEGDIEPKGTVVMVHGNPSWTLYYRNLIGALKGEYRCIAMDNVGCGLSDKPDDSRYHYTLTSRVGDLEALLAHLNVTEKVTLVVHDWGGMIGMGWATKYPDAIERLVILNTAAFHLPASKPLPLRLKICRDTWLGTLLVRGFNAFAGLASVIGCKRNPMSAQMRRAYVAPFNSWANRISTLRFVQDIPLKPGDTAWDEVSRIEQSLAQFTRVPTLICWGLKDFVFDRHFLTVWQEKLPQAEVHAFEDCGHYILEDASDEVIAHIQRFVAAPATAEALAS
ncbi:alpha/beta fold hydrolase [Shewanella zhangzhouensis]|uniref:alpha/beta fold hydrolase n=1 Tax=Shewanella zhangzhouensis TaxID=2864213 RepID=UPI001C6568E4|nr:alpha/beta fold hydrolase [Shewanella zhangzhouensis]QYK07118.1 alpha/beta fold hydrolase [Shewanella zhangzhouensis]